MGYLLAEARRPVNREGKGDLKWTNDATLQNLEMVGDLEPSRGVQEGD